MKRLLLSLLFIFYSAIAFANTPSTAQQASLLQTSQQWAAAIDNRNPQQITALYAPDAILYATFQNMLDNQKAILNYFNNLTQKPDLKVVFNKQNIRIYNQTAVNSGLYTFSYINQGKVVKIPARYTFVYAETPNGWLIVEHHSSTLPEQ